MTKKQLYKQLHKIAKEYNIKCRIYNKSTIAVGYAHVGASKIQLNIRAYYTVSDIISIFFHEIAHILDYRDGLFKNYLTNPSKKCIRKWALRVECHADWRGCKLKQKYFPAYKQTKKYNAKNDRDWLLRYYRA